MGKTLCDECFLRATLSDGTRVHFRPLLPQDRERWLELVNSFSPQTQYFRFLAPISVMTEDAIKHYLDNDFIHAVAIVATIQKTGKEHIIAVARYYAEEKDRTSAEFAIVIQDGFQGRGLGLKLMRHLCSVARQRGVRTFYALVFKENEGMLKLLDKLGFGWHSKPFDADTLRVEVELT